MRHLWIVPLLLFVPLGAEAEPLNLGHVAADAKWVIHLDADAMRITGLFQNALKRFLAENPDAARQLEAFHALSGTDLTKDVHGVTVFGRKLGRNDGLLIFYADMNSQKLIALVTITTDYRTSSYRTYQLHCWTDAKGLKNEHNVAAAFYKPRVLLVAPNLQELKAGLDVLDGRRPSMAGGESPVSAAVPAGTVISAWAAAVQEADLPFESPLLKECETLSVAIGEHQGQAFVEAKLTTKSAEIAEQLRSILNGLRSMAELQRSDEPDAMRLIKRFTTKATDKTVLAEFRASADELWAQFLKDTGRTKNTDRAPADSRPRQ
jgi:hypothetical protein